MRRGDHPTVAQLIERERYRPFSLFFATNTNSFHLHLSLSLSLSLTSLFPWFPRLFNVDHTMGRISFRSAAARSLLCAKSFARVHPRSRQIYLVVVVPLAPSFDSRWPSLRNIAFAPARIGFSKRSETWESNTEWETPLPSKTFFLFDPAAIYLRNDEWSITSTKMIVLFGIEILFIMFL